MYSKTTWIDRIVEFPNRFTKSSESASAVTLTASPGTVTEAGTPLNAANLNNIEQGIEAVYTELDTHKLDFQQYQRKIRMGAM
jgi:hypothetical protein